ncbi:hypothetical protein NX059_011184 [Plenodomus lindquistii]|nr:hypothetical protein NX059_011184 [Plenodomus lindquistii]
MEGVRQDLCEHVKAYIKAYSAADCLALIDKIQEKLPLELREMVYGNMLPDRITRAKNSTRHLLKPGFADPITKYELHSLWYKTSILGVQGLDALHELLKHGLCGLQLSPQSLIRKVEVYDFSDGKCLEHAHDDGLGKFWCRDARAQGIHEAGCLFDLRHGAHIMFKLEFPCDSIWGLDTNKSRKFVSICVELFSLLGRLVDSGYLDSMKIDTHMLFKVIKSELSMET